MGVRGKEGQMIVAILIAGFVGATLFSLIVLIIAIVRLPVLIIAEYRRGRIIKERLDVIEPAGNKEGSLAGRLGARADRSITIGPSV
jgi:hypothetical protein